MGASEISRPGALGGGVMPILWDFAKQKVKNRISWRVRLGRVVSLDMLRDAVCGLVVVFLVLCFFSLITNC